MNKILLKVNLPVIHTLVDPLLLKLAWAGGFVDGEGCIRIAKHSAKDRVNSIYNLHLSISQNRLETLEYCYAAIGMQGSITEMLNRGNSGRPVHLLTYNCADARDALAVLQPYLVRKAAEAALALEFAEHLQQSTRGGNTPHTPEEMAIREGFYLRMKALK